MEPPESSAAASPAGGSPSSRSASARDASSSPRQLKAGGNPFGRAQGHAQGLAKDVRAWLEMRFELAKIEFFERADEQLDQVVLYAIVGALAAVGGLVMLLATCFALSLLVAWIFGWLAGGTLGALTVGFLLVALFFLSVAGLLFALKPHFGLLENQTHATVSEEQVMEGRGAGERVAPGRSGGASPSGGSGA